MNPLLLWKVVIPSNDDRRLRIAVNSILATHPGLDPKRIVVVDDGAKAGWLPTDPDIAWVDGVKPFIYARNVNLGLAAAGDFKGLVIMGDDCNVATQYAFDMLDFSANPPVVGISSAAIDGPVGNHQQRFRNDPVILETPNAMAFICVYIRRAVWQKIGRLDERFVGYGCEDTDFCKRVKDAGLKFIVDHRVRVIHNGPDQPSAWRTRPDISAQHVMNKQLLSEKWVNSTKKSVGVLGLYRVKNEARWIKESLERTLQVAEKVILFDDHSTDQTREIARSFKNVAVIESPFEGLDEARDKDHLFKVALTESPRWVVFIDGDEVLTKRALGEIRSIAAGPGGIIRFRIVFLWDLPYQERYDGVYARMCQPRMFSVFDQDVMKLAYRRTGFGGNFHCGQVPLGHLGPIRYAYSEIKHYGYLHEADRIRKHAWYNEKDPGNKLEGEYAHIIGKPSRHAPGPILLRKWMDA